MLSACCLVPVGAVHLWQLLLALSEPCSRLRRERRLLWAPFVRWDPCVVFTRQQRDSAPRYPLLASRTCACRRRVSGLTDLSPVPGRVRERRRRMPPRSPSIGPSPPSTRSSRVRLRPPSPPIFAPLPQRAVAPPARPLLGGQSSSSTHLPTHAHAPPLARRPRQPALTRLLRRLAPPAPPQSAPSSSATASPSRTSAWPATSSTAREAPPTAPPASHALPRTPLHRATPGHTRPARPASLR